MNLMNLRYLVSLRNITYQFNLYEILIEEAVFVIKFKQNTLFNIIPCGENFETACRKMFRHIFY